MPSRLLALALPVLAALALAEAAAAATPVPPPVLAAAGDIACVPGAATDAANCRQGKTADELVAAAPSVVATLGDAQYDSGTLAEYLGSFDPTWGRLKSRTYPVPGNHDYHTAQAAGYFDYFNGPGAAGGRAGLRGKGYYSYDVGQWRVIALNSNCPADGPASCTTSRLGAISPEQVRWLAADLAGNLRPCTVAYWHAPLFSSGDVGASAGVRAAWDVLQRYGADVVLAGHDHDYERFAPQDSAGRATRGGIREFVVGTGGDDLLPAPGALRPNSETFRSDSFGALFLSLGAGGYGWSFKREDGVTLDTGSAKCNASAPVLDDAVRRYGAAARSALGRARIRGLLLRRGVSTSFRTPALGVLRAEVRDGRTRRRLASGASRARGTGSLQLTLRASATGRRVLRGARRRGVMVTVAFTSSGGVRSRASARVTLRR